MGRIFRHEWRFINWRADWLFNVGFKDNGSAGPDGDDFWPLAAG